MTQFNRELANRMHADDAAGFRRLIEQNPSYAKELRADIIEGLKEPTLSEYGRAIGIGTKRIIDDVYGSM